MELKFVAATKPKKLDGITKQRAQLIKRINEQIAILENHDGGPLPRRSWAWQDENGVWLLCVQYGYKPLEMKKGMSGIQCESIEHAAKALDTVRAMVVNGDFDAVLAKVSADIRAKFKA